MTPQEFEAHRIPCESCGGSDLYPGVDDARCRGCNKNVCQSCVDMFGHIKGGPHLTGDPSIGGEALTLLLCFVGDRRPSGGNNYDAMPEAIQKRVDALLGDWK